MNREDIKAFIRAFVDFNKHAEVEMMHHYAKQSYLDYELRKKESKLILEKQIEEKAAELEVTVDYYIAEFM